jgi:hypothetical protein
MDVVCGRLTPLYICLRSTSRHSIWRGSVTGVGVEVCSINLPADSIPKLYCCACCECYDKHLAERRLRLRLAIFSVGLRCEPLGDLPPKKPPSHKQMAGQTQFEMNSDAIPADLN